MTASRKARRIRRQAGSAALEVLLLIPFILLIFMLLLNMGYNSERKRKTLASLRLGGAMYVTNLTTMNAQQASDSAESLVNNEIFRGQNDATLIFSTDKTIPQSATDQGFKDDEGLLAGASSRVKLRAEVKRNPPYVDLVDRSPAIAEYSVSTNTWTYCEMKDSDFASTKNDLLKGLDLVGNYALWLFGGCGGGTLDFSCDDKCP